MHMTRMKLRFVDISLVLILNLGLLSFSHQLPPQKNEKITGGKPVDIEKYPYIVQMLLWSEFYCAGSIISELWIVTAAHCTAGTTAFSISVRAGTEWIGKEGVLLKVSSKKEHPDYDPSTHDYDLSLMRLSSYLSFGINISPVTLPIRDAEIRPGSLGTVAGWGSLFHGGPNPVQLYATDIPVIDNEECDSTYAIKEITDRMICTLYPRGRKDACTGDSGGPLVYEGRLIGIVSWGAGCGFPSLPCVYTNIPKLRGYIFTNTGI